MKNQSSRTVSRSYRVLKTIYDFQQRYTFSPTIREIGNCLGISSTSSVNYCLDKLEQEGLIERLRQSCRTIRITRAGLNKLGFSKTAADIRREVIALLKEIEVKDPAEFAKTLQVINLTYDPRHLSSTVTNRETRHQPAAV